MFEEPFGNFPNTLLLDQYIEDNTVLIYGTPKVMLNAWIWKIPRRDLTCRPAWDDDGADD